MELRDRLAEKSSVRPQPVGYVDPFGELKNGIHQELIASLGPQLFADGVEQVIGRRPDVLVPSNRAVPRSLNDGEPILLSDPRAPVSVAFRQLTAMYLPDEAGTNGHRRGRLRLGRTRREVVR